MLHQSSYLSNFGAKIRKLFDKTTINLVFPLLFFFFFLINDVKIIYDLVFGFIRIPRGLLYNLVQHPLFQRLNRINQLGLASVVYPGARHTRFQHSLGAFHLMSEAILNLQQKGNFIFDSEAEAVEAAILMHDIGHGTFSHVLEGTLLHGHCHADR